MGNKLYEESDIQDIAVAAREINGSEDTYTVSQMGAAIRSINRRVYKGEVSSTILGATAYVVLLTDDVLAQHRNDDTLFIRVKFDFETPIPYTVVEVWGFNKNDAKPFELSNSQFMRRYGSDGAETFNLQAVVLNGTAPLGVGCLLVTESGELLCHSLSNNYAIRPSEYTIIVEW